MKEALKLAFEVLEDLPGFRADIDNAITALRLAIDVQNMASESTYKAALAQPAQEPVAWWDEERDVLYRHCTHDTDDYHKFKRTVPLYAYYPPQRTWVDLTEDEMDKVRQSVGYNQFMSAGEYAKLVQFVTQTKLKEKNT